MCSPSRRGAVGRACGAAAAGEWAMELRDEEQQGPGDPSSPLQQSYYAYFYTPCAPGLWKLLGALQPV